MNLQVYTYIIIYHIYNYIITYYICIYYRYIYIYFYVLQGFSVAVCTLFARPGLNLPASVVFSAHNSIWISLPSPEVGHPREKLVGVGDGEES